jgi:protein TonB
LPEKRQTDIYLPDGSTWNYPVSRGIVLLQFNENTSYECYLQVQNELGLAFDDIRNTVARNKFGKGLDQLTDCEEESLIKAVPMVIQEANPLFVVADSVKIRNLEYTSTFSALKPSKCNEPARYEEEEFDIVRLEDRPIGPSRRREIDVYSGIIEIVPNDEKIDTTIDFYEFTEDEFVPVAVVEEEIVREEIVESAETMPSFQGGDLRTFHAWVQKNITYPMIAQENGIQGRVLLSFVIDKDGSLGHIRVLQTPDISLTEAAVQVLKKSPKWRPAMNKNKPVRLSFTMPVDFRLNN